LDYLASPFVPGRPLSTVEAITIARRATYDPGAFTRRRRDHNGEEPLHVWCARAAVVALGADGPLLEGKWSQELGPILENARRSEQQWVDKWRHPITHCAFCARELRRSSNYERPWLDHARGCQRQFLAPNLAPTAPKGGVS